MFRIEDTRNKLIEPPALPFFTETRLGNLILYYGVNDNISSIIFSEGNTAMDYMQCMTRAELTHHLSVGDETVVRAKIVIES